MKLKLGIIGWRGMVGQVLMERLLTEEDFKSLATTFFSTSQAQQPSPFANTISHSNPILQDANDLDLLKSMDILISCQGGEYTKKIHGPLRSSGYKGFWIDAASTLRMTDQAVIILDPVNLHVIQEAITKGQRDFIGGNCTVSLMMLAIGGLLKADLVEWVSSMTYQAASGAGARHMAELLAQNQFITNSVLKSSEGPSPASERILEIEKSVKALFTSPSLPKENFGYPLAFNLLPWIDSEFGNGQSREEWKGSAEANKILQTKKFIPVDGTCVRVGSLRCHSQGLTIKLRKNVPLAEIENLIQEHNPWVELIPNSKVATLEKLTPAYASGSLKIPIGRLRKMNLGEEYLNAFTVGDQLLWGAAEPLRRMLQIIKQSME